MLDPGALLPTPADLAIGFASSLQYALSGTVTGTGSYSYDPAFGTNKTVTIDNVILTFGDVRIAGTAEFALEKRTVSVDENGNAPRWGGGRCEPADGGADGVRAWRAR